MATAANNPRHEGEPSVSGAIVPFCSSQQTAWNPSTTLFSQQEQSRFVRLQTLLAFGAMHEQVRRRKKAVLNPALEEEVQFTLDERLQLIADRAVAITGADGLAIALPENNDVVLQAAAGAVRPDLGACIDRDSAFSGACLRTVQILSCDDTEADARVNLEVCRRLGVRSMVAVPLCVRRHEIGLLQAFSARPFGFDDSDVRNLRTLADLLLAALAPEPQDRLAETPPVAAAEWEVSPNPTEATAVARLQMSEQRESAISRFGMPVLVMFIVIASALWGRVFWRLNSTLPSNRAVQTEKTARKARASVAQVAPAAPVAVPAEPTEKESHATRSPDKSQGVSNFPVVTGIQHRSSADSTTVVLDLGGWVQYEAHRLANPHRIYFDLHGTQLASGLAFKKISVGDAVLKRIRVAQSVTGMTRLVLETNTYSDFSANLDSNPYRLVIEVRKPVAGPKRSVNQLPIAIEADKKTELPNAVSAAKPLETQRR